MMACLPGSNCFPRCSSSDSDKPSEAKITAEIRNEIKSVSHLVRKFHSVSNDYFIRSTPDEKPSDQNRMQFFDCQFYKGLVEPGSTTDDCPKANADCLEDAPNDIYITYDFCNR